MLKIQIELGTSCQSDSPTLHCSSVVSRELRAFPHLGSEWHPASLFTFSTLPDVAPYSPVVKWIYRFSFFLPLTERTSNLEWILPGENKWGNTYEASTRRGKKTAEAVFLLFLICSHSQPQYGTENNSLIWANKLQNIFKMNWNVNYTHCPWWWMSPRYPLYLNVSARTLGSHHD